MHRLRCFAICKPCWARFHHQNLAWCCRAFWLAIKILRLQAKSLLSTVQIQITKALCGALSSQTKSVLSTVQIQISKVMWDVLPLHANKGAGLTWDDTGSLCVSAVMFSMHRILFGFRLLCAACRPLLFCTGLVHNGSYVCTTGHVCAPRVLCSKATFFATNRALPSESVAECCLPNIEHDFALRIL